MPLVPLVESSVVPFERRLDGNLQRALNEGGWYFEERGSIWQTCRKITALLDQEQIAYAITGALALFHHGYRRFTQNVNLLVAAVDFERARHAKSGFVLASQVGRNLIDETTGVRVHFVKSGEFPGGGNGMGIQFPDPSDVIVQRAGLRFLTLPVLIDLKLAAGLSNRDRLRDVCDIEQLIIELGLGKDFADHLNPRIQSAFREICQRIDSAETRYLRLIPMPPDAADSRTIEELLEFSGNDRPLLESMRAQGVILNIDRPFYQGSAIMLSMHRLVARKFDMHPESDHWFP
ncbi:MAG TPA: hypothetical protein VMP01_26125 [Pirellulaceae bacterium]|nr:hypothetical protein [Pirellulaceae bacterium]